VRKVILGQQVHLGLLALKDHRVRKVILGQLVHLGLLALKDYRVRKVILGQLVHLGLLALKDYRVRKVILGQLDLAYRLHLSTSCLEPLVRHQRLTVHQETEPRVVDFLQLVTTQGLGHRNPYLPLPLLPPVGG
jgi:hypothetical protein